MGDCIKCGGWINPQWTRGDGDYRHCECPKEQPKKKKNEGKSKHRLHRVIKELRVAHKEVNEKSKFMEVS